MATSLDWWLVIKYDGSDSENDSNASDSNDIGCAIDRQNYHCGLEIKTPSSKKLQNIIRSSIDLYGSFLQCEFGSLAFKKLVYKPEYRVQVLHHAAVANLKYILFVVAGSTKVHYSVLIRFPDSKISLLKSILSGVYHRSRKWTYTTAWVSNDLRACIPNFREEVVLQSLTLLRKTLWFFLW